MPHNGIFMYQKISDKCLNYYFSWFSCTFKNSFNGIASCYGQKDIHNKLYKKYTKSIKHNLKLIALMNNIKLFLDSKQCNLHFEHLFVGIHQVLRKIWFMNMNFKLEILANFEFLEV